MRDEHQVEISDWAFIVFTEGKPSGGTYTAYDRETNALAGALSWFWLGTDEIQFKEVTVRDPYRRRRVATALLRYLNLCHPAARINPGVRNTAGSAWMQHILDSEQDKVASNGILNVPLQRQVAPGFRPGDAARMYAVQS